MEIKLTDKELEALKREFACHVLQGLLDQTCNNCKGSDVRLEMEARKRSLELEIEKLDAENYRP